ncbi:Polyadenylate-binding protein 6 [Arabidopsis thaliana]|uniref:PAB6 n=2 Tax=Arabidopsis TaxID=3701 RepID=A0A178VFG1_ARATH|nr:RNA recognition motif domain [Arabidopsis thaliana x Arabidopsis arenosa]OAP05100.1 PAB6 [Arabidopsis thaliana]
MALVKTETQALGNHQHSSRFGSLYVGDLSPDVTEKDLIDKFSLNVPVVSVHLCRNSVTGKSMCYAYINFDSPFSASNAMTRLNHSDLKGKAMRIMWSQRDLAYRRRTRTGFANLYVKNLNSSITSSCLERMFCPFGSILSCKVVEENGQSKGFGFVQFDTEQSAVSARSALHGSMVYGKKLFVAKFINKDERAAMAGNQDSTNVYVKNLIETVTDDCLHTLFSQYGTVSSVVVMRDGMGRSRGFGFVNFCNPENAKKAMESLCGLQLGSKKLFVGKALKKDERREMLKQKFSDNFIAKPNMRWSNLYVKNLSESMNETRLREIFGCYGQIVSAKVMCHENGRSKGFGFVCFSNCEESKQAKRYLNGFLVDGKPLVVRVAERKEDRIKRLQQYFQAQPRQYTQAPSAPSPAQPVLSYVPSSYGCFQPFQVGTSYYYMGNQVPQMSGHQNITTYVPAGKVPLKERRSMHLVYKHLAYPVAKRGSKQTLVFKGEVNRNLEAGTCSKATTSDENRKEERRLTLSGKLSPEVKVEESGKQLQ